MSEEQRAQIARLDAMIERTRNLPSLPMMAARLEQLTQLVAALTARVAALEQECDVLRKGELIRLFERET
jgi:uncharacterized protein Yka (UPF0111/DUF47 family)